MTQTLADVAKDPAREELHDEKGIQAIARSSGCSFEETRVITLDFLDTNVFHLTVEHCKTYLDPLIKSWSINLANLQIDIVLNHELSRRHSRRFELVETGSAQEESGLGEFLRDESLSGDAIEKELAFLKSLRFDASRPTSYYYYRALQNLRDPLHFREPPEG